MKTDKTELEYSKTKVMDEAYKVTKAILKKLDAGGKADSANVPATTFTRPITWGILTAMKEWMDELLGTSVWTKETDRAIKVVDYHERGLKPCNLLKRTSSRKH